MKKSVSNYIMLGCSVMAEVVFPAIINYRAKKKIIGELQAETEKFKVQLNRTDRIVIRPRKTENEEDKIRTQNVSRKTEEVLNNMKQRNESIKELNESMEELNKLFDEIIKLKEMTEEDRIRTQWKVKSTGEVLNKKNIDEKIENEEDEEKKRFYEYLKSEFLT